MVDRVLVVCQHFHPENFRVNDLVDFLLNEGFEVDVLCGLPNYPEGKFFDGYSLRGPYKELPKDALRIFRVPEVRRASNSNLRIFANYVSFPVMSLFRVPGLLFRRYDYVVSYQLSPVLMMIAAIIVAKIKKIPLITYVLDLWPENLYSVLSVKSHIARSVAYKTSSFLYSKSDAIVALSKAMEELIRGRVSTSKIITIALPQPCEDVYEKIPAMVTDLNRTNQPLNIVYTGNLSPAQSMETLVDAVELLRLDPSMDFKVTIVGGGMSHNETVELVNARGLAHLFDFVGQVPLQRVTDYLERADFLVGGLAAVEGLDLTVPSKVFSYIASGRPIVIYMSGLAADLVEKDAMCGFASSPGSAKDLAENMRRMSLLTSLERAKMGARGRKFHEEHLSRQVVYREFVATMKRVGNDV